MNDFPIICGKSWKWHERWKYVEQYLKIWHTEKVL